MPTIDKAVGPLLVGMLAALYPLLSGGSVDYSVLLSSVTGLITFAVVYFVPYAAKFPNKALAAVIAPVLIALASAYSTGDFNSPEFLLAIQGLVGFVVTYVAKRYVPVAAEPVGQPVVFRRPNK